MLSRELLINNSTPRSVGISLIITAVFACSFLGSGSQAWSQSKLGEELRAIAPISFSTVVEGESHPLGLFNLLRMRGAPGVWEGAQVEIKYTIDESHQALIKSRRAAQEGLNPSVYSHLPPSDYEEVGHLKSLPSLVKTVWAVWVPSSLQNLTDAQRTQITTTLNLIAKRGLPESQLYLYAGHSFPKLALSQSRLADLELNKLDFMRAPTRPRSGRSAKSGPQLGASIRARWSPGLSGLSELFTALNIQLGIEQKNQEWEMDYQCGRPCSEVTPHVRLVVLRDADADPLPMTVPQNLEAHFEALKHPQHKLFRAQVFFLEYASSGQDTPVTSDSQETPTWLSALVHHPVMGDPHETPRRGGLRAFKAELDALKSYVHQQYYVIPAVSLNPYFWNQSSSEVSLRVTIKNQSFVRQGVILRPPDESLKAYSQRQQISRKYRKLLTRSQSQVSSQSELSLTTKVMIVALWVIIFVVAVIFTTLILRKNRHLSSDPKITQLSHNLNTSDALKSALSRDEAVVHLADASTVAPVLKKGRPSHASPMIDPDQPSTVPAPAATESNAISLPPLLHDAPEPKEGAIVEEIDANSPSDTDTHLSVAFGVESPLEPLTQLEPEMIPPPLHASPRDHLIPFSTSAYHSDAHVPATDTASHLDTPLPPVDDASPYQRQLPMSSPKDSIWAPLAGLYAEAGPMHRLFFLVTSSPCRVGRDPETDCPLPPSGERSDRKISREHFELLLLEEGRWEIRCVSSQGLIVGETRLAAGDTALIRDQDLIVMGATHLRFRCSEHWRDHIVSDHLRRIAHL